MTSNRKTSTISDQKNKHVIMAAGKGGESKNTEGASQVIIRGYKIRTMLIREM